MSNAVLGVKTAKEYIEEYSLLRGENPSGMILVANLKTGEITDWDVSANRKNEVGAAMRDIYAIGTGVSRADFSSTINAYQLTQEMYKQAIDTLSPQDPDLVRIIEDAMRHTQELKSRAIDFQKLCVEYSNELEVMLEYLKEYLNRTLAVYKTKYPNLLKAERKIKRTLKVPVSKTEFGVFESIEGDRAKTDEYIQDADDFIEKLKSFQSGSK